MKYEVKPEDIRQRTFKFGLRIIALCKELPRNEVNRILINQVLRSGTSIGANLEEATGAHTKSEFINCTNIARREARETHYWLKLIYEISNQMIKNKMKDLINESNEIVSILVVSVKNLQRNNKK
ncbi:MAG: four helix bundle protein [Candidatus Levybacteria bacterium]|nr:four helix bundle protein [Candidatus Levybacteria bacterium]